MLALRSAEMPDFIKWFSIVKRPGLKTDKPVLHSLLKFRLAAHFSTPERSRSAEMPDFIKWFSIVKRPGLKTDKPVLQLTNFISVLTWVGRSAPFLISFLIKKTPSGGMYLKETGQ